jgi:hypothetical protein
MMTRAEFDEVVASQRRRGLVPTERTVLVNEAAFQLLELMETDPEAARAFLAQMQDRLMRIGREDADRSGTE